MHHMQSVRCGIKRVPDCVWDGGSENREAPIRLCHTRFTSPRNFEVSILDATANPYIALAGILKAGSEGIVKELPLSIKDCFGDLAAAQMDETRRKALGIEKRLPLSWDEGRKPFIEDQVISRCFGEEFVKKYLAVNKLLGDILENSDDGDEAKKLTGLVRYYYVAEDSLLYHWKQDQNTKTTTWLKLKHHKRYHFTPLAS
ncbi:hypothetical protein DL96DRAFT_1744094 [Flagelloscypha sp. PMI_526]|nr:hypothetical protein DL96DRAFT_1744094 [Flagelloscypha sp. PMI_526]